MHIPEHVFHYDPATGPEIPAAVQQKADNNISAGRLIARRVCPYFRPMLNALVPKVAPGLKTVAVNDSGVFFYDPFAVAKWSPNACAGALIHEVFHLWNAHNKRRKDRDSSGWNDAADRAINPGVIEMGLEFPFDVLMPKDLGMQDGLSADEYYREAVNQGKAGKSAKSVTCGGCVGNPHDGEPQGGDDPDGKTEAQITRAAKQVSEEMSDVASGRQPGKLPAAWARIAGELLEPPRIPWRKRLAQATRQACQWVTGHAVQRYDAPSRRQAGIGFGPGKAVLPRLRLPVPNVAIAIDTSGSMSPDNLTSALVEAKAILKAVGAKVKVCVCDADVHAFDDAATIEDIVKMLKGGGGTDFRPVFAKFEKTKGVKPDVLVFVTDGYGPAPDVEPTWCRTIWLLVGKNAPKPAPWGEAIHIDDLDNKEVAA